MGIGCEGALDRALLLPELGLYGGDQVKLVRVGSRQYRPLRPKMGAKSMAWAFINCRSITVVHTTPPLSEKAAEIYNWTPITAHTTCGSRYECCESLETLQCAPCPLSMRTASLCINGLARYTLCQRTQETRNWANGNWERLLHLERLLLNSMHSPAYYDYWTLYSISVTLLKQTTDSIYITCKTTTHALMQCLDNS